MQTYMIVDTGTSSMRGILFSRQGELLYMARRSYQMDLGPDGSATMDAGIFRISLGGIIRELCGYCRQHGLELQSIAFTSQRSSVLAVDQDGHPLAPILMWYDKRCVPICDSYLKHHADEIYQLCGMRLTPVSSVSKMCWLKEHWPDVYQNAHKLLGIHDYLLYLACQTFVTDASLASRTALMDIQSRQWSPRLCDLFGIDLQKLCPIHPPSSIVGVTSRAFSDETDCPAGLPVITAGGDQQACSLGLNLHDTARIGINSGTATYASIVTDIPAKDPAMQLNVNASCIPNQWILEASNMGSASVYQWFCRTFYPAKDFDSSLKQMDEEASLSPAGAGGMLCAADFAGRGCPSWDPHMRGSFSGISLTASRGDFSRALLEGICAEVSACCRYLTTFCNMEIRQYESAGGLSNFSLFNQILADMLNQEVVVPSMKETTALGGLISSLYALKIYPSPSAFFENGIKWKKDIYYPDQKRHELYQEQQMKREKIREQAR